MSIGKKFLSSYSLAQKEEMSIDQYLVLCKGDRRAYATAAERMLDAIGTPVSIDTSKNQRLSRIHGNRIIKTYPAFAAFYGMDETIEKIVNYFRQAAQGLEESKQLLYLLGPVGGGKSSLVERVKDLMELRPFYTLGYRTKKGDLELSPYFASPLGLFNKSGLREAVVEEYNIDPRYINSSTGYNIGPWEVKRLAEFGGDINKFVVVRMNPARLEQINISITEPGDENTQDIASLVGKVDIRKLEEYKQNDPDAYLFSGALNRTGQGITDFREMFKAKPKMLHPLLFAVQEHNYQPTEAGMGAIPFHGIVMAHSNEAEWDKFKNNKDNEAFLDRVCIVKVPYCLQTDEETKIYEKYIQGTELKRSPIAPGTFEMLSKFAIMTRLTVPENSKLESKMRVYNGENLKELDPNAKPLYEYRDDPANRREGFSGISTRWGFKKLSAAFNADPEEVAADPVYLLHILRDEVKKADLPPDTEKHYLNILKDVIELKYYEFLDKEVRTAFLESYQDYGQNLFDRYVIWADHWIDESDYFDGDTNVAMDKAKLNEECEKVEKPAGIANPKDFRNEVVRYVMRYAKEHEGKNPDWRSYEKLRLVIEKRMFANSEDIIPVISSAPKGTEEDKKKHSEFLQRMRDRGYTDRQIRRLVDWYIKIKKTV